MGKRKRRKSAGPTLFDLPLHKGDATDAGDAPGAGKASAAEPAGPSILFDDNEPEARDGAPLEGVELAPGPTGPVKSKPGGTPRDAPVAPSGALEDEPPDAARERDPGDDKAYLGDRLLGGLADLAAQLIALGLAVAATHSLDIVVTAADWMPFGVLALVFSFVYWMMPLAFWGQTPGMAWVGHTARSSSGEPLSFGQTFMRWLGALLTLAFAGLPLLIALTGRSLSDRLSDSKTFSAAAP